MNAIEKLILGFIFLFIGTGWMTYAFKREKKETKKMKYFPGIK
jgi:hypothetical protein